MFYAVLERFLTFLVNRHYLSVKSEEIDGDTVNHDNQERLIAEASKIRDVYKRKKYLIKQGLTNDEVETLIDLVHFRTRGRDKFPRASKMRFTRDGLAMASGKAVAEYRTWKIRERLGSVNKVLDVGAGIGGDTIVLAFRWKVLAVESDPEMVEILKHNIRVYNVEENVTIIEGDITELVHSEEFKEKVSGLDAIFYDPSRRNEMGRTVKTEEYTPPLDFVKELLKLCPNLCVKISPGTEIQRIDYDCDIEVVSNRGNVKEVVLWFGGLKQTPDKRSKFATMLPEKITREREEGRKTRETELQEYLYEPDPAFIKGWLTDTLAAEFGLTRIHPTIAFLTGNNLVRTPLLNPYWVLSVTDNSPELINRAIRELGIGRIDFKARGVKVDLKNIHKGIHSSEKGKGLVVFTKIGDKEKSVICRYA
jgi:SAM-dependent methyltransferase